MLERDDGEHPIPMSFREVFRQIAASFVAGDYLLADRSIDGVNPIEVAVAGVIARNVSAYGDQLALLQNDVWERSCYRWMDGYWSMLIDLSTVNEAVSDLTIHANLRDAQDARIEVWSVHVP